MPQMNFDLEDGQEPVSFLLSNADSERFMAFMADCNDAIKERKGLLDQQEVHLDALEALSKRNVQLEKEIAQLKQKRTGGGYSSELSPWKVTAQKPWLAYCPDNGIVAFETEAEATAQAEEFIEAWLDADTGWDELVDQVFVGRAIHISSQVDRVDRPEESEIDEDGCDEDGHYWGGDYEYFCNYQLQRVGGQTEKLLDQRYKFQRVCKAAGDLVELVEWHAYRGEESQRRLSVVKQTLKEFGPTGEPS